VARMRASGSIGLQRAAAQCFCRPVREGRARLRTQLIPIASDAVRTTQAWGGRVQFGRGQGGEGDSFRERRRADQGRKEAGLSIQETKDAMGPKGLREEGGGRRGGENEERSRAGRNAVQRVRTRGVEEGYLSMDVRGCG